MLGHEYSQELDEEIIFYHISFSTLATGKIESSIQNSSTNLQNAEWSGTIISLRTQSTLLSYWKIFDKAYS